jgi:hypothetical protein
MGQVQWFRRWITRGSWFEVSLGKKLPKSPSERISWRVVVHVYNSSYLGGIGRKILVCGWSQTKIHDPI